MEADTRGEVPKVVVVLALQRSSSNCAVARGGWCVFPSFECHSAMGVSKSSRFSCRLGSSSTSTTSSQSSWLKSINPPLCLGVVQFEDAHLIPHCLPDFLDHIPFVSGVDVCRGFRGPVSQVLTLVPGESHGKHSLGQTL